jgi:hypothetical protein
MVYLAGVGVTPAPETVTDTAEAKRAEQRHA